MSKESSQTVAPRRRKNRKGNNTTIQQNAASTMDGRTRGTKRKAIPDKKIHRKRTKVSESESQNTSEVAAHVKVLKRKVREDGEGPSREKKKRRLDLDQDDKELASPSIDTDKDTLESRKRSCKRKVTDAGEGPSKKRRRSPDPDPDLKPGSLAAFVAKYKQQTQLGQGGCGSVFRGYRIADKLPVAIKHIPKDKVFCKHKDQNGKQLSVEVAIMLKLAAETTGSVGSSAPVSLLDWYDLDQELILVLERPVPSKDLLKYIEANGGSLPEEQAKTILKQLVDAAKDLQDKCIFHRDIKMENILIETSSDVPRVRLIDFGLGCFVKKRSRYKHFYGTIAHVPPEWYHCQTYSAGPTTVWQLGLTLFELLHKNEFFQTTVFLRNKLKIRNTLSADCQDFLRKCLNRAPEQRPTLEQLQLHPWIR